MDITASRILFRFLSAQVRKNTEDFTPDLDSLLALEEILIPLTRAQKNLTRAYTLFVQIKTPKITPDGMIGGKGFMISLKDVKDGLNTIIDKLAIISDAVEDEVSNNPIWQEVKKQREQEPESDLNISQNSIENIEQEVVENLGETEDNPLDISEEQFPINRFKEEFEEESHITP